MDCRDKGLAVDSEYEIEIELFVSVALAAFADVARRST
jgi:hypothetical protein